MRVICLMMQKDETLLLEAWIVYYGYLFGYDNLYIFDNGSTSAQINDILKKYENTGIHINISYNRQQDFENKGLIFKQYIEQLRDQGDMFIPLDCDEFFTLNTTDGISCDRNKIHAYLETLRGKHDALLCNYQYLNIPYEQGCYYLNAEFRKTFFNTKTLVSLDIGFHCGRTISNTTYSTNIVYLHYHFKPYDHYLQAAKNKLTARLTNFTTENLLTYHRARNPGYHVIPYLILTEENYYKSIRSHKIVKINSLIDKLRELDINIPF